MVHNTQTHYKYYKALLPMLQGPSYCLCWTSEPTHVTHWGSCGTMPMLQGYRTIIGAHTTVSDRLNRLPQHFGKLAALLPYMPYHNSWAHPCLPYTKDNIIASHTLRKRLLDGVLWNHWSWKLYCTGPHKQYLIIIRLESPPCWPVKLVHHSRLGLLSAWNRGLLSHHNSQHLHRSYENSCAPRQNDFFIAIM